MRIGPAANVARLNVAEDITALWTFANALGLLTDVIGERTVAAGVTIDGVTLRDIAVELLGQAVSSDIVFQSDVFGDAVRRFVQRADGGMEWGDGAGARDVNLIRASANVLATFDSFSVAGVLGLIADDITERTPAAGVSTPDDFNVGGVLVLGGDLELSERTVVLGAGGNDDVATGIETVQRLDADTNGANLITGFAGGRAGRMILVVNIGTTDSPTLGHDNAGSVVANRLLLPLEANRTLSSSGGAWFLYDGTVSRWRLIRTI